MSRDLGGLHILIVCADRQMSSLFGKYLRADCVHSEAEAVRRLRHARYDVLVVEFMTGGVNGFALMEQICRDPSVCPQLVIALSALCSEPLLNTMQRLKVSYVLKTPCTPRTLSNTIRQLLQADDPQAQQEEKLQRWLMDAGCSFLASGLRYLVSCVSLYLRDDTQTMKVLYVLTAQRYQVTPTQVESAIRNFTAGEWLHRILPESTGRLTKSQVICMLAERKAQWIE